MKIKPKLALAFLLLSIAPLAVSGLVSSTMAERALSAQVLKQLESVAAIQKSRLENIFQQNHDRLWLTASRTQMRRLLARLNEQGREEDRRELSAILQDALVAVGSFREITVLDLRGRVAASTDPGHMGEDHAGSEHFKRGRARPSTDMFFLDQDNSLRCRLAGPLFWEDTLVGVMVIDTTAENVVSLVKDYSGLGRTGETLIARQNGVGEFRYITPLRFDPDAALRPVADAVSTDLPMSLALRGEETLLTDGVDYRGRRVLAATRFLASSDLGLVVKLDRDEAFAPMDRLRGALKLVTAVSALLVIVLSIPVGRSISRPIVDLAEVAARISGGDLTRRAREQDGDETGILARSFNTMTEKLTEDLTRRRQAEEQLRARTDLLQGIIDNSLSAIFVKDVNQRFIMVNKVFGELCGRSREDILGRTTAEIFPLEIAGESGEHDRQVMETGAALKHERVFTLGGAARTYIATKFPLYAPDGAPYAVCGIYTDISEIKQAVAMREEVERMIRHDLRSPLMAIAGLPRVIKDEPNITARQREMLASIEEAGRRMLEIIGLSQDLYRMETGSFLLEAAPVDLLAVARRTVGDGAWLAERKRLTLRVTLAGRPAGESERLVVAGREALLYTMLANLVINALEASPEGETVEVALAGEAESARVVVRNKGAVPREIRSRFFEKYVSAGKKTGTGIGTYNARLIAQAHGGGIAMQTTDEEGTEVTVRLPRHPDGRAQGDLPQ